MSISETREFLYSLRTGNVRTTKPKKGAKCGRCHGSGKEYCVSCHGHGRTLKPCECCAQMRAEQCPSCKGHPDACKGCHGDGKISSEPVPKLHPADVWTVRELRKLSINGSFR